MGFFNGTEAFSWDLNTVPELTWMIMVNDETWIGKEYMEKESVFKSPELEIHPKGSGSQQKQLQGH